jgi:hypothetical protein
MNFKIPGMSFLVLGMGFVACAKVTGFSDDLDTDIQDVTGTDDNPTGSDSGTDLDSASESFSESQSASETESSSSSTPEPECKAAMSEAFEGSGVPNGWLVQDGESDGYTWEWRDVDNDIGGAASGGYFMVDAASAVGAALKERLVTVERDYFGCQQLELSFDQLFSREQGDLASVEISINGEGWQPLRQYDSSSTGQQVLDLSSVLSSDATFRLSFLYDGSNGQFWKLDNVRLYVPLD